MQLLKNHNLITFLNLANLWDVKFVVELKLLFQNNRTTM